jgi:hypothetical protein
MLVLRSIYKHLTPKGVKTAIELRNSSSLTFEVSGLNVFVCGRGRAGLLEVGPFHLSPFDRQVVSGSLS